MGVSTGGGIKSIQRVAVTFSGSNTTTTATIASVNTAKTQVRFLGGDGAGNSNTTDVSGRFGRLWLNDATTVGATRGSGGNSTHTLTAEITEWY